MTNQARDRAGELGASANLGILSPKGASGKDLGLAKAQGDVNFEESADDYNHNPSKQGEEDVNDQDTGADGINKAELSGPTDRAMLLDRGGNGGLKSLKSRRGTKND